MNSVLFSSLRPACAGLQGKLGDIPSSDYGMGEKDLKPNGLHRQKLERIGLMSGC